MGLIRLIFYKYGGGMKDHREQDLLIGQELVFADSGSLNLFNLINPNLVIYNLIKRSVSFAWKKISC